MFSNKYEEIRLINLMGKRRKKTTKTDRELEVSHLDVLCFTLPPLPFPCYTLAPLPFLPLLHSATLTLPLQSWRPYSSLQHPGTFNLTLASFPFPCHPFRSPGIPPLSLLNLAALTLLAELPGEALGTAAPSGHTLPLAVAVRHLTLVVTQLALLALEPGVTLTLPGHVVTVAGTQDGTQHCRDGGRKASFIQLYFLSAYNDDDDDDGNSSFVSTACKDQV